MPAGKPIAWYGGGLRFACTQCGNCCSGAPGYVYVTPEEARKIAEYVGRPDGVLGPDQIRRVGRQQSLTERPNGDCIFLKTVDGKRICGIYPVRPVQCRTWPFWDTNLDTEDDWNEAARDCPGMNGGAHHTFVQIERYRTAGSIEDLPG